MTFLKKHQQSGEGKVKSGRSLGNHSHRSRQQPRGNLERWEGAGLVSEGGREGNGGGES